MNHCTGCEVLRDRVKALELELAGGRGRRCSTCRHWIDCDEGYGNCTRPGATVLLSWWDMSCAQWERRIDGHEEHIGSGIETSKCRRQER